MILLLAFILALAPIAGTVGRRRRRSRQHEGKLDGALLLAALACSLMGIVLAAVGGFRATAERRQLATSRPVEATVTACHVIAQRTGGRDATQSHELRCEVALAAQPGPAAAEVRAGYPRSRTEYDAWVDQHPAGSSLTLRQSLADNGLWGLELLVPVTTSAGHTSRRALAFGAAACVLLALSRFASSYNHTG